MIHKIYLILLLFVGLSFAQVVSETFSNFYHDSTDADLIVQYRFDGVDNTNDYGPNGYDLTAFNSVGDSLMADNPLLSGGNGVHADSGSTHYWKTADLGALAPANDFTYAFSMKAYNTGASNQWYIAGGSSW